jgi:hypothetical protein
MLQKDLGRWAKSNSSPWSQDLPEGAEPPAQTEKYEVDYSRFDKIDDVEDKPALEERDWFCDDKGNVRPRQPSGPAKDAAEPEAADAGTAIKKGFLDNAKAPLYPKGSEQKAPAGDADFLKDMMKNKNMMKELETMMGEDGLGEFMGSDNPQEPKASKPSIAAKVPERKAPTFTLEEKEGYLEMVVAVPGLDSMQGVDLDVRDRSASMAFPSRVALKPLKVELPTAILPTSVRAKFSKKTQQVTVKLPLA